MSGRSRAASGEAAITRVTVSAPAPSRPPLHEQRGHSRLALQAVDPPVATVGEWAEPNLRDVIIAAGASDVLTGQTAPAIEANLRT